MDAVSAIGMFLSMGVKVGWCGETIFDMVGHSGFW
jgi:hypothetical protein